MSATSRELVWQTLHFENPCRVPKQLWSLPWAEIHYPAELKRIQEKYPSDIATAPGFHRKPIPTKGCSTSVGTYSDEFGCEFVNIQEGVIGEVKKPKIVDWEFDAPRVRFPTEHFTIDRNKINRWCDAQEKFILAGCCPRPFEQMQFLRGTAELYMDLMIQPPAMMAFLEKLHEFYCELLDWWSRTHVDGLIFMDDWGTQQALLISPELWRTLFKPLYRDYIQIAHSYEKAVFMHSDGYILDIYPDLVELGVDAINSQLFCMGVENLKPFAGRITFWGEIDRQHILASENPQDAEKAVEEVYKSLWCHGGCIAQCEFGPGARPDTVEAVFATWDKLTSSNNSYE